MHIPAVLKKAQFYTFLALCIMALFFLQPEKIIETYNPIALATGGVDGVFYADLKEQFILIATEDNPSAAIDALEKTSLENNIVRALCHDILHGIGRASYEKYGSIKNTIKYTSDYCNSGYIHGVFESYFKSTADPFLNIQEACNTYAPTQRRFDIWQCNHGIGHGLMYFTDGDVDSSLELCSSATTEGGIIDCQNGVYMELFNSEYLSNEKDILSAENPFEICANKNVSTGLCYMYAPTYLSQTKHMSYADIFKECATIILKYKSDCVGGVASEAMKRNMENPKNVFALCSSLVSTQDQTHCVNSLVRMYLNQEGSTARGAELCSIAPEKFKRLCLTSISKSEDFFK